MDPGHGGDCCPGAEGPTGLTEKEINLTTALYLRDFLVAAGCTVYMTRETDEDVDLSDRSGLANLMRVDRCISIHHDGNEDTTINHTKVYVWTDTPQTDLDMASEIVHELDAALDIGVGSTNCDTWGVVAGDLHMVREPVMPCCLPVLMWRCSTLPGMVVLPQTMLFS